jgi:hypothetical protein
MDGILDAAITAARHADDSGRLRRYQVMRKSAGQEREHEFRQAREPGNP